MEPLACPICLESFTENSAHIPELSCNCSIFVHLECWEPWTGECLYCRISQEGQEGREGQEGQEGREGQEVREVREFREVHEEPLIIRVLNIRFVYRETSICKNNCFLYFLCVILYSLIIYLFLKK